MTSPSLASLGAPIADHLWQSTLFAVTAALLIFALRKHSARTRYWLWLVASLKFFVPFSFLVTLGSRLSWLRAPDVPAGPSLYYAMEQISRPFSDPAPNPSALHPTAVSASTLLHTPAILAAVWLLGFITVVVLWIARWVRVSATVRKAILLSEGRELAALRRVEGRGGITRPIPLLLSQTSLEPGIFGVFRPVLIWPEGISQHLDDPNLEAVIAHEVWHVRRRDNLFALIHMLVEAVFWFYPLVWWLGSRLIDERERACDEEVVALGNDRQIYAESILKVCEFCLGSPLPCVSGVTGADLKKRMVHIMNDRILHQLGFARKLLLTACAFLAIALPVTFGLLHATPTQAQSQTEIASSAAPMFESVSIKPNTSPDNPRRYAKMMFSLKDGSFMARGVTLRKLIELAYHLQESQLVAGPDWLDTSKFDVDAKLTPARVAEMSKAGGGQPSFNDELVLQSLLATYFKVSVHNEARNLPVYELTVDENGSKLKETKDPGMFRVDRGELTSQGAPIELLANQLSTRLGRTVVDNTGLKGNYAFNLRWVPDPSEDVRVMQMNARHSGDAPTPAPATDQAPAATLSTAVQEQLGLKLEPRTEPIPVLVVDHAEQPSE